MMLVSMFWASVFFILYPYFFFPAVLWVYSFNRKPTQKCPITPSASIIIAAYNEEQVIERKIQNAIALDYPENLLEIIVVSDGSDDGTATIVRKYKNLGVKFLDLPRRGKVYALDDAVAESTGEILVFSDANTLFEVLALRNITRNFCDSAVGGVCGNQVHSSKEPIKDTTSEGERLYWNYDKWLKTRESLTGSIVSADGAIYAIRRSLYEFPGSDVVTDDFAISTNVIEKGFRLVFESEAVAYEPPAKNVTKEFRRKVRIINRGMRSVVLRRKLLNPFRYGFYSVILFSHKIARRLVPLFLITLFVANALLWEVNSFFLVSLLIQIAFYTWAGLSFLLKNTGFGKRKIFYAPYFFCLANYAALIAILGLIAGRRVSMWQPPR